MDSPQKPRICISVCESTLAALEPALATATQTCDLVEVRLDCIDPAELEHAREAIRKLINTSPCTVILTLRPAEQGGRRELDIGSRYVFWTSLASQFPDALLDVELDLAQGFKSSDNLMPKCVDWDRVICSHHDFVRIPVDVVQIYERMAATPARVLKIAVRVDDATDCLQVFKLLERARGEQREMIAIAMGSAGIATRILGPAWGAFLTYAGMDAGTATAPGQLSVRELKEVYRVDKINQETQIFGLIGNPVSHSVSPGMQNAAFASSGINAVFIPFQVGDAKHFLRRMINPRSREMEWNVGGLSVTAPHKSAVMDQLDWIDAAAREIGAVNTIVVKQDQLHGYNTDAHGFISPLREKFGDLRDARCAVIGSGGAAMAAVWALKQAGADVTIFARNSTTRSSLGERFRVSVSDLGGAGFEGFDVVVNATPLGTKGHFEDQTAVSANQLRGARVAYDLVYNPIETKFLQQAGAAGCETLGGLKMLVAQAVEQFKLWTGGTPVEGVMYEAALRGI